MGALIEKILEYLSLRAVLYLLLLLAALLGIAWSIAHQLSAPCTEISLFIGFMRYVKCCCDQEELKKEIYEELSGNLEGCRGEVDRLRSRLYTLTPGEGRRGGAIGPFQQETPYRPHIFLGRLETPGGEGVPDVKVEILGGSQVYSNSSGEFRIEARVGDRLIIGSQPETKELTVSSIDLKETKVFTLRR